MPQTEMTEQEVGTLVYWELSQLLKGKPSARRSVTVTEAIHLVTDRLARLNPERPVARRLQSLLQDIINIDDDDAKYGIADAVN